MWRPHPGVLSWELVVVGTASEGAVTPDDLEGRAPSDCALHRRASARPLVLGRTVSPECLSSPGPQNVTTWKSLFGVRVFVAMISPDEVTLG